ncbi:CaiB/BaiF CoA-transferase family protein [Paracoccus sp. MKU1]|uniref:CaiB/BaiF CoA transferase family protein n=1 Tax=Paracoccus sp. MKU1 TaxID=1745182 RepID=UPI0007194130|nr:CoA transferase [Paracoccus sp. MKU1]KRW97032.1 acyl-CoA transferase [Paracoccus sp. MKU1]
MPSSEQIADHDERGLPLHDLPVLKSGAGLDLLRGVRVIDLTTSVAGPYAPMLLSDFGAEVIKVERSEGDDARDWGPPFLDGESLWFAAVNRNKKSVVVDLGGENGRAALDGLIATGDVFITNQPPSVQKKLGLDHDSVRAIRQDIVFTSITGFGLGGARADLTCYDLIAEGYSGIMDLTGEAGGEAQKIGAPAADMLAGQDAAMATIAALFDRASSGKGRLIDVSLVESMTRFLSCRAVAYLGSGEVPTRSGGTDSVIAIYQAFETADEPLTLGLGNDAIWKRFWQAVGDPDYAARPEFSNNALRRQHRATIVERIQSIMKTAPRDRWLALFAEQRVPAGPINGVDAVAADPELQRRGMFYALDDNGRLVPQVGLGIRVDGEAGTARSVPPTLGSGLR